MKHLSLVLESADIILDSFLPINHIIIGLMGLVTWFLFTWLFYPSVN